MRKTHPVPVYLIRHGKAGDRTRWTEPDEFRPLSKKGRRQAEALALRFRTLDVARVITSPHLRCVQTVRPIAIDRELPLEVSEALSEGAPTEAALALVEGAASGPTVLCSHGDIIPAVVLALADRGMALQGSRDWKKGSTWVLEAVDGRFTRARYLPPPKTS
jgi:8-oxo-dGTP diphosphatase